MDAPSRNIALRRTMHIVLSPQTTETHTGLFFSPSPKGCTRIDLGQKVCISSQTHSFRASTLFRARWKQATSAYRFFW